ncbi:hypothetical protein IJD34_04715 [bacterium]|nr:hypothetical protein [bacterium]
MRKQVIAYLHTHWDREWYREFEIFRMRLLRVFDNVLSLLDENKIPSFYFDGQVAALEDYLELRPEKEKLVRSLIRNKKLFIGPFYCLVDEFLTDKTCFSKNLELGMSKAIEWGCTDFIGYLPDTFGHSQNVPDILRDFGIDKCIVWRGCGDFPAEFKWCGMDTVNLVRGYFHDVFAQKKTIEEKAEILKKELDLISEKSSQYILLPIGADHLGVPVDIQDQIAAINEILKEDYVIRLDSPFEYFKFVEPMFKGYSFDDELRDNSKTFTLQGCYSSRLDLKRYNVECSHKLDLASRYVSFLSLENPKIKKDYTPILDSAYKMLLQNQAHDSICGCSVDGVHQENIIRYKKILNIAHAVIEELKFATKFENKTIINLSDKPYTGMVEFRSTRPQNGYEKIKSIKCFTSNLLADTYRIPVTEDYTTLDTYITAVKDLKQDVVEFIMPRHLKGNLEVTEKSIENDNISLLIMNNQIYINEVPFKLIDFIDLGDSYNFAPKVDDKGVEYKVLRSKVHYQGDNRVALRIDLDGGWDVVTLIVTLDRDSVFLNFSLDWINSRKNHVLYAQFELPELINEVYSEDMDILIKREFNPNYDIRKNLPQEKGREVMTNTAPMQRGLLVDESENNLGIITKGLTQYEVFENYLRLPILRATGIISNPLNPARTTPAGPPIETPDLQMLGENKAEFNVFFGNQNDFETVKGQIFNYIIT